MVVVDGHEDGMTFPTQRDLNGTWYVASIKCRLALAEDEARLNLSMDCYDTKHNCKRLIEESDRTISRN